MQVTTGRSAARSTLLFRLSLIAGLAIVAATLALVWFYRWRELSDLRHQDSLLHSRIAASISAPAPSGFPPGERAASLSLARDASSAGYILSRSLFGAYGSSALLWSPAGKLLAFGGAPQTDRRSPEKFLASGETEEHFFEAEGKTLHSTSRPVMAMGQPAWLEIRTDLSEPSRRIASRAADVAFWALLMEGALIGFLLWIARKGDERLIASEREQIAMESELFFLAHYDAITHLPNRSLFWERLDASIGRASRLGKSVSVMAFDLKDFQRLNEERGRGAGDRALIECARRLQAGAGASDLVCRIGADEFVVLLEDMDPERAQALSLDLARSLERQFQEPWIDEGLSFDLLIVGGGALFPRDGSHSEELLAHAQSARVQALANGVAFSLFQP